MKFEPEIEIICHEEECPVRGNAQASGEDDLDREMEDQIIARLESGDIWAWCCVEVKASFMGLSESEYLGCCSYDNEADFCSDGYYSDMKQEAVDRLRDRIRSLQDVDLD